MVKPVKRVPERLEGATKFQGTEIKGRRCSYLQSNENNRSHWKTGIIHQSASLEQSRFELVNLTCNKLFNTCIHWRYDATKKLRKKRMRIKGVSTLRKCSSICNCKGERANRKWTWGAYYRMNTWSPPEIKWGDSVENILENRLVKQSTCFRTAVQF